MQRFPVRSLLTLALLASVLSARPAAATDFNVVPLQVSITLNVVVPGQNGDTIVKKTLKNNDVINLALGRPLGTKIDKKREILALTVPFPTPEDVLKGQVIVLDPTQNGLAQITTVVAQPTHVEWEIADLNTKKVGHGTVTGTVVETTLGTPALNALHATTSWFTGTGSGGGGKGSAGGVPFGPVSFTATEGGQTATFSGFIVKGKAKATAKVISLLSDTVLTGCGDGIVEAGEECDVGHEEACPGNCLNCLCDVCGNNRKDLGEICDGTDDTVCQQLGSPGCRPDCQSCIQCGDGIIDPPETCEPGHDSACPGRCLTPECTCGCDVNDPNSCPGDLCCSGARCWAPKTGFASDDPNSPITASGCSGGGTLASGLCGGLVPPGGTCPDNDADPNTLFECDACGGKFVSKICTLPLQNTCVLDHIGPLP